MPYTVLIVDDSSFFQVRLKEIIEEHSELKVVGVASNGREAIEQAELLKPDIISMDYEMPLLDGVTAVREILAKRQVPIVMFSSMTYEGATITLQALEAGAVDFVPKNFAEVSRDSDVLKRKLHEKLITFARASKPQASIRFKADSAATQTSKPVKPAPIRSSTATGSLSGKVEILVIGASTGGPVALTDIITRLPENFPLPILIVQHMPENFTKVFAERLHKQSKLSVKEAEHRDKLKAGTVLVAPGGKQLMLDRGGDCVKIISGDDRVNYKPSVDILFASAAQVMGNKVLGLVLTGMGADGCDGARLLKDKGSQIWTQDEGSCVVYGMPAAVAKAGLTDMVLPIEDFSEELTRHFL